MNETKRMSSTARKLNLNWLAKLFFIFLFLDILLLALSIGGWCYGIEMKNFGEFILASERSFRLTDNSDLLYFVRTASGMEATSNASEFLRVLKLITAIVSAVEVIILLDTLLSGTRRIRKKLKPLHDIAQKAEALSRIAFDETKFHHLEEAISNLSPVEADSKIKTDDKELQGIEIALNNLLERMRDSYRQQSRFVSDASHELRTPIAVIKGYVDMLDRWGKQDADILEEAILALKQESAHMNRLVEQLLFLARGDSGRNKMNFEKFSLSQMIREVFEESVMIDPKHRYELAASGNLDVTGDFDMLKQTARILIDNSAKYTKENDTITIRYGVSEMGVPYFSIQDNGIGMHEADAAHIFERFYRADSARNSFEGGTGLGLSIAKWIIDRHNGYFEVLSRLEIGTRITVFLKEVPQSVKIQESGPA